MACPSDDDLSAYLAGRVSATEAAAITVHVEGCRQCDALVEVLGTRSQFASAPTVAAGSKGVASDVAPTLRAPDGSSSPSAADEPVVRKPREPSPGDAVGGYVLQRRVGAGGMGVVWEAYDPGLDRAVAIKLMRDAAAHLRIRFDQEVRITARLQHPSIVNIFEAGTWGGEPYYVMKLVRGESLDRRLSATSDLAARLAMLPGIIAVTDAIAYAHSARVIHRDLKPENVLLGEFGEAVVIDWGVAKQFGTRTLAPSSDAPPIPEATSAGAVIGTPAYMPPEQARGEAVDARADVYALGAILYGLLTGSRPYADAGSNVLAAVIAGPPAGVPNDAPADLATIVAKAMARDAAERYPTAKELANDLKRFQTGQLVASHRYTARELFVRWLGRHRTAIGVGAVALAVLAVMGVVGVHRILDEKEHATAAQLHAEDQRGEVEKLLTVMLGDIRAQLAPIGKVAVLEKIATQAEEYFDASVGAGDPHLRIRAKMAIGDVLMSKGNVTDALDKYRAAEHIARTMYMSVPHAHAWWRDIAEVDSKIGMVKRQQGDLPGAIAMFREQAAFLEALAKDDPGDMRDRDLSVSYDLLASMLIDQGSADDALALFRKNLELDEAILARKPDDADRRRSLALTRMKIGMAVGRRGDLDGALAELRIAVDAMKRVVAAEPEAQEHARDLAAFRGKLAMILTMKGLREEALAEHQSSLEALRMLVKREPDNARYAADLANALSYVANLLDKSDPNGALALCQEARAIRDHLVVRDPTNTEAQSNLLASSQQTSMVLLALHRPAEALPLARAAVELGATLAAKDPTNAEWQENLLLCHAAVGDILIKLGDRDGAVAAQRKGLEIALALVTKEPTSIDFQRDVGERHDALGDLLWERDRKAAIASYRSALAVFERLVVDDSQNPDWPPIVARLRKRVGM